MTDLQGSLFDPTPARGTNAADVPLAARMRPRTLDEVVGQRHLVAPGRLFRRLVEADQLGAAILFGPPGVGKTSLVHVLARTTERTFVSVNATNAGVKELREAIALTARGGRVLLHVEEVHRLSRTQVEVLLDALEHGVVGFVGTTTENPYLAIPPAIRSRSTIFELRRLSPEDVGTALRRALADDERGLGKLAPLVDDALVEEMANAVGGDVRTALNAMELAVAATEPGPDGHRHVTADRVWEGMRRQLHTFSESDTYDLLSALQKSVRGSDPDAAAFYVARMVSVELDLPTICRRLVVMAAEDVGNAYPLATAVALAAAQAAQMVGYPEARIPLVQAATFLASCPKSNAAYMALSRALEDIEQGRGLAIPAHLRDSSYRGAASLGRGKGYKYPHDHPGSWVAQRYLPDDVGGKRYYVPTENGAEKAIAERLERLRSAGTGGDPSREDESRPAG